MDGGPDGRQLDERHDAQELHLPERPPEAAGDDQADGSETTPNTVVFPGLGTAEEDAEFSDELSEQDLKEERMEARRMQRHRERLEAMKFLEEQEKEAEEKASKKKGKRKTEKEEDEEMMKEDGAPEAPFEEKLRVAKQPDLINKEHEIGRASCRERV